MKIDKHKIEVAMARSKLNRDMLAAKTGMPAPTIYSAYSRGSCKPRTAGCIAEALGVDITEILEDQENGNQLGNHNKKEKQGMRLKSEKVKGIMGERGLTEEMLVAICGIRCIENNCFIAPAHAKKLALVLGVDVAEIVIEI